MGKKESSSDAGWQEPVLPTTVSDQIRLWEAEKHRIKSTEGEYNHLTTLEHSWTFQQVIFTRTGAQMWIMRWPSSIVSSWEFWFGRALARENSLWRLRVMDRSSKSFLVKGLMEADISQGSSLREECRSIRTSGAASIRSWVGCEHIFSHIPEYWKQVSTFTTHNHRSCFGEQAR
jgi:hypothetical protein